MSKSKSTIRNKGNSLIELLSDYTVIDIETTGLDPCFNEIIEIGALKVRNGTIVDKFESLIKPINHIDEFITKLTGITNKMLQDAPDVSEVLPEFIDFIQDDILVGHNVNFDINFLYDSLIIELDYCLQNDFIDTLRITRKIFPDLLNHKLATISNYLKINIEGSHRALADCLVTNECYQLSAKYIYDNNIDFYSLWKKNRNNKKYHKHHETQIDLKSLVSDNANFDVDHPLYGSYCAFTGELEKMTRKEAAQLVVDFGGFCLNSVTKQTNFLILGNFEYISSIKDGKSSKLRKAEDLILKGQDLEILSENVFYSLLSYYEEVQYAIARKN
jgi:DNA polymerase-3 subunit epsilon